jgi:hypothetical protein
MKIKHQAKNPLRKRAKKGFRGYPVATIAFYGPTAQQATKVAVGIITHEGGEADIMERWYGEDRDLRFDEDTAYQISAFLHQHQVLSVAMTDRIIGCPHEEVVDYPEGEACPQCPYWRSRDRFTGEMIQ